MEQSTVHVERPDREDGKLQPNLLIVWLDKHIGQSGECILLKRSFFKTADPSAEFYEMSLDRREIDRSILSGEAVPIQLDNVQFMLRAFDSVEKCFEAIENNRDKRIFLITSGSKGRIIVPSLVANFPETFVKEYWMYIFCAKMNMISTVGAGAPTNEWAFNYEDNVLMYNFQDDLLARMVLDIATYFFTEAERLDKSGELESTRQYYRWSKRMCQRYEKMEKQPMTAKINEIDRRISEIEQRLSEQNKNENDPMSEPCD